jgi:hypothetical protein
MADPYRRSISELITRYTFEPTLRDLYVEGERDRFMLGWMFQGVHCPNVRVYGIETVDVPVALMTRLNVGGNKGRIVALCELLAEGLSKETNNVLE